MAICAVVTVAATVAGREISDFDVVTARNIFVMNDEDEIVVRMGANDGGHGLVNTQSAKGKDLVTMTSTVGTGGIVQVWNKTGEDVVQLRADEYGNGVVYAGNRKGKGRTLQPGP